MQFLVCFQSFTETKLFASSLLRCSIFSAVLMGTIQFVTLFYMSCCVTECHEIKINMKIRKKYYFPPTLVFRQTAHGSTRIFSWTSVDVFYAATLIGRITALARPSVRPSVCTGS